MNRGRRRGGGPSLSGLRDGVKRRLFDPHSVPTKPDPKFEVSRLIPFTFPKAVIHSSLSSCNADDSDVIKTDRDGLQINLFESTAKLETAFRSGPFYHPVPELSEGISAASLLSSRNSNLGNKLPNVVSLLHLLVAHDEINQWSDEDANMKEPDDWYPEELISRTRQKQKSSKHTSRRSRSRHKRPKRHLIDIDEVIITDHFIQQVTETLPENDDDVEKVELANSENEDADSEDARWNDDVNRNGDPDELDEDEFDNDYCQQYFDNGEKDFSDDELGGDDEGGSKYYE